MLAGGGWLRTVRKHGLLPVPSYGLFDRGKWTSSLWPSSVRGSRRPQEYVLEYDPDALILRRVDGTFVAAFSIGSAAEEVIVRAVEEDLRGWPAYCGPVRYAGSARRLIEVRIRHPWERFLQTERRALEARRKGRMAKALSWRLPGESQKDLDRIASEDRRRAEEGLVELSSA